MTAAGLLPEERLLLALAHIHPTPADRLCAGAIVALPCFSWERAWNLASRQWVHPILAKNIHDDPDLLKRVPERLPPLLNLARFSARVRQAAYEESLGPVFAGLADAGVDVVLMKGAAMLARYPADTRLLNDVDILIRESDAPAVTIALEAAGFRNVSVEGHELTFVRRSGQMTLGIDVHWSLHDRNEPFSLDPVGVMSRAEPVRFGAASIRALSSEDTLLNYGMQLIADNLALNALRLSDIRTLAAADIRWPMFCETAIGADAAGACYLALGAARLAGADVPDAVLKRLERHCAGCRIVDVLVVDPRWPMGRFRLAGSALNVLVPMLCSSRRYGARRIASVPIGSFAYARRNGVGRLGAASASLRATVLTLFSASMIAMLYLTKSPHAGWLASSTRILLWRRRTL